MESYSQLSGVEADVCVKLRLRPRQYLAIKESLLTESYRRGFLRPGHDRQLLRVGRRVFVSHCCTPHRCVCRHQQDRSQFRHVSLFRLGNQRGALFANSKALETRGINVMHRLQDLVGASMDSLISSKIIRHNKLLKICIGRVD